MSKQPFTPGGKGPFGRHQKGRKTAFRLVVVVVVVFVGVAVVVVVVGAVVGAVVAGVCACVAVAVVKVAKVASVIVHC